VRLRFGALFSWTPSSETDGDQEVHQRETCNVGKAVSKRTQCGPARSFPYSPNLGTVLDFGQEFAGISFRLDTPAARTSSAVRWLGTHSSKGLRFAPHLLGHTTTRMNSRSRCSNRRVRSECTASASESRLGRIRAYSVSQGTSAQTVSNELERPGEAPCSRAREGARCTSSKSLLAARLRRRTLTQRNRSERSVRSEGELSQMARSTRDRVLADFGRACHACPRMHFCRQPIGPR